MRIFPDNLPAELRENGLFCCWRYEERNGKRTKVPYNPRTQGKAQSTNPTTFAPLSMALETMERGGYDGIGVGIFDSLGAIDIDHCVDDNGQMSELARDVADTIHGYTEFSPSGQGLRILFTVPEGFQYDKVCYYINNQRAGLEVYIAGATKKYVTVTGNAVNPGYPLEERGAQLAAVLEKYMMRPSAAQKPPPAVNPSREPAHGGGSHSQHRAECMSDSELIERASQSRSGIPFARLWVGDASSYKSRSEADIALCNMLAFWTNKDAAWMDRLFRQSGLMREKWDRRQSGSTYGAITIQNAIASCHSGYDPQAHQTPAGKTAQEESIKPRIILMMEMPRYFAVFIEIHSFLWMP